MRRGCNWWGWRRSCGRFQGSFKRWWSRFLSIQNLINLIVGFFIKTKRKLEWWWIHLNNSFYKSIFSPTKSIEIICVNGPDHGSTKILIFNKFCFQSDAFFVIVSKPLIALVTIRDLRIIVLKSVGIFSNRPRESGLLHESRLICAKAILTQAKVHWDPSLCIFSQNSL